MTKAALGLDAALIESDWPPRAVLERHFHLQALPAKDTDSITGLCGHIRSHAPTADVRANTLYPQVAAGQLEQSACRDSFFTRAFALADWQNMLTEGLGEHALTAFHARYKYLVLAYDPQGYKSLGQLLGRPAEHPLERRASLYVQGLMASLGKAAEHGRQLNALLHVAGYLKQRLNEEEQRNWQALLEDYRSRKLPLAAPLELLRQYFRRYPDPYIQRQTYLDPYPSELVDVTGWDSFSCN
ncbi:DUF1722 domain-containing protein [Pseudomonas sp. ABC1]|uniref:YbgA family protein n=1 Tax=Pseudomonas sp. ABC1 TaxID=2748080 RepID=UPI0015C3B495|nr:DUF1722 domain-containing protein [Pseudomonas sp. ABC1]QLF91727.1 DUF1722 domain-containing protein [Pseudomonas sp. ABC1]